MKKLLEWTWLVSSRLAIALALAITSALAAWNRGHDVGYVHAMADVTLGQVVAEDFMIQHLIKQGRLDPKRFLRKDSK